MDMLTVKKRTESIGIKQNESLTCPPAISNINPVMTITGLIKKLEEMKSLYGDLPVYHDTPGDGMEGFDEVGSVSPIYGGYMGQDKTQPVWCIELA
jgi:hypothetical protein